VAKDIVFLLHGIGQSGPGWIDQESGVVPVLHDIIKNYPYFEGKSLDLYVEFHPQYWLAARRVRAAADRKR
jgi:hypothetical protein